MMTTNVENELHNCCHVEFIQTLFLPSLVHTISHLSVTGSNTTSVVIIIVQSQPLSQYKYIKSITTKPIYDVHCAFLSIIAFVFDVVPICLTT